MRTTQYTQREARIRTVDSDGIRQRWAWGLRLLADEEKLAPAGGLRHGVADALIAAATKRGYKLSASEIRYRMQCARTYPTEAQIAKVLGDFETWWALIQAAFPACESPASEPPADWRTEAERTHDRNRAWLDATDGQDAMFPLSQFEPVETTLADLETYMKEQQQINENFAATFARRRAYLDELASAVDGDMSATWDQAQRRLDGDAEATP
jgi:hypothetical protein